MPVTFETRMTMFLMVVSAFLATAKDATEFHRSTNSAGADLSVSFLTPTFSVARGTNSEVRTALISVQDASGGFTQHVLTA